MGKDLSAAKRRVRQRCSAAQGRPQPDLTQSAKVRDMIKLGATEPCSARGVINFQSKSGGAVAQLGARLDGIEAVVGSNPIGSTKNRRVQPRNMGNKVYR